MPKLTLAQWLDSVDRPGFAAHIAAKRINGAVYIPDCTHIEHMRTYLWSLSDYLVSSVSGGSVVLIPR